MAEFASGTNPHRLDSIPRHRLVLMKGDHVWLFRWTDGGEHELITTLSDLAADQRTEFDWFDAAMVRHQLSEYSNGTNNETH